MTTGNIYRRLLELLPDAPLRIGTVTAHNADLTSTITLLSGAVISARGIGVAVGLKAYVRDGIIEGEAPNLPTSIIEI